MATRVSILGARCQRLLKPLMKNFWLMTMTMAERTSCKSPSPTGFWWWLSQAGAGQPHMAWPMEKYISTSRNPREAMSRRFSTGVSWSSRAASSAAMEEYPLDLPVAAAPLRAAP